MHPLQKQFHNFNEKHHLFDEEEKILITVSGGLDSMVMLSLFYESKLKFAVAHCNFRLRGEDSERDEHFVVSWTKRHLIKCYVKRMDSGKVSIQLKAREARYKWFNELCEEHGYSKIATAHHLDDSLETSIINLVRGTGIKGLKGIMVKNDHLIRPLLFASKRDLLAYAQQVGLDWREDLSNQKTDYDRNKIRLEVIPVLKQLNSSLMQTHLHTKERIEYSSNLVDRYVRNVKEEYFEGEIGKLSLVWIKDANDVVILSGILADFGFNYAISKEVFAALGKPGKTFLSVDFTIYMDRTSLFIKRNKESCSMDIKVNTYGEYLIRGNTFNLEKVKAEKKPLDQGKNIALFDAALLSLPFNIRTWRNGDFFHPLGMKGSKKVSDFLIDEKVPLSHKKSILIVEKEGEIAWVVGMRISELFKVSNDTSEVIKISNLGSK